MVCAILVVGSVVKDVILVNLPAAVDPLMELDVECSFVRQLEADVVLGGTFCLHILRGDVVVNVIVGRTSTCSAKCSPRHLL